MSKKFNLKELSQLMNPHSGTPAKERPNADQKSTPLNTETPAQILDKFNARKYRHDETRRNRIHKRTLSEEQIAEILKAAGIEPPREAKQNTPTGTKSILAFR